MGAPPAPAPALAEVGGEYRGASHPVLRVGQSSSTAVRGGPRPRRRRRPRGARSSQPPGGGGREPLPPRPDRSPHALLPRLTAQEERWPRGPGGRRGRLLGSAPQRVGRPGRGVGCRGTRKGARPAFEPLICKGVISIRNGRAKRQKLRAGGNLGGHAGAAPAGALLPTRGSRGACVRVRVCVSVYVHTHAVKKLAQGMSLPRSWLCGTGGALVPSLRFWPGTCVQAGRKSARAREGASWWRPPPP